MVQHGNHLVRVADARERFVAGGPLPEGLVPEVIARSWHRCLERSVGPRRNAKEFPRVAAGSVAALRERSRGLIVRSQPVMEQLYQQICGTSSVVVLTDDTGVVLHSVGDQDFAEQAQQVSLLPGAIWTEEANGTNAIGTALIERDSVAVHSAEHFLEANQYLTCSAAPIFDPVGRMLGVLDVSGAGCDYQRHTLALVRMSAQMIENQFFAEDFSREIVLHFHIHPEFIGTLYEAIAVFSLEGRFLAGNRAALMQLGLDRYDAAGRDFSNIFDLSLAGLFDQARVLPQPILRLALHNGVELYGRVKFGAAVSPITNLPIRRPDSSARDHERTSHDDNSSLARLELGDPTLKGVIRKALKVIGHDIALMIEGESGSGKEMFAQAFHADGPRRSGPFVALNCAAIPEGLIESELFGYRDGAFTGARRTGSVGKIQQADGGTLFLDEIGDMPSSLQARLLRVLQDRTVTPLGGSKSTPVDIKVICATNRRLRDEVAAGRFREDLYYRLNGLVIILPPLRDREDKISLAHSILTSSSRVGGAAGFAPEVIDLFRRHPWPGNVRQLANVIRTALALSDGEHRITLEHLPDDFLDQIGTARSALRRVDPAPAPERLEELEAKAIREALQECNGNVSAAARKLGIVRSTIYRKLKK